MVIINIFTMNTITIKSKTIISEHRSYASKIPLNLITQLVALLEIQMEKHDDIGKLFLIQYSFFEKINDQWILKNFLDIGDEIVSIINLDINEESYTTNFVVYSENPNYNTLRINQLLDMRNRSEPDKIYACDLYIDFEPIDFVGECYTSSKKN